MKIRTLMLGWEFPPFISGGLGTACFGLTRAMDRLGMPVTFVLPRARPFRLSAGVPVAAGSSENLAPPSLFQHIRIRPVAAEMRPYVDPSVSSPAGAATLSPDTSTPERRDESDELSGRDNYGSNIYQEVERFAEKVIAVAESEEFELIHAHDWMTFPAGVALAAHSGKPLVIQVHSTEFDRSGEHVNQYVYDIERHAMHAAAKIIAVSNYTRNIILGRYGVAPEKVEVVYNGVEPSQPHETFVRHTWPMQTDKIVLFLGRITMQKGPEYFLQAARKVLDKMENVKFVMAGDGDMLYRMIELAAELDIGHQVLFTRFLRGDDVDKAYQMADLYVMPSVSEPFGIAPLEALRNNVPVLISKQSGIAETFRNALKVDFWDINEMANKMIAVLRHPPLQELLRAEGHKEAFKFRWEDSAACMNEIYHKTLGLA
ncbi:MAG: glycosyltransferase family 4 protein [Phycisphaerales bacterium]|nr:MAG: glycosyltransferase family 4 protein [Phycisphaerales bacterium]